MFRQVWIGGKKSTGYQNLNKFQNLKLLKKNDVFLYFCREIGSDLDTRSPIDFSSALDIWVSASSSWTLDGFSFQFLNFEYIDLGFWFLGVKFDFRFLSVEYIGSAFGSWVQLSVPGVKYIDFGYQFQLSVLRRLLLISAFGSWTFWLSVLGSLIYKFWLSVLGHLILVSAFCSWVMAATSHWALDRFQLRYLWICEIQRMLQNFLFKEIDSDLDTIRKSAPEFQ
ncbi:unnamed protein product [Rhizophagus irregularis]|nr:unnamed protein product [Rhizophagus irregularis]